MGKNLFSVEPNFPHGEIPGVGILLAQLGTPEAPTAEAGRPYLKQLMTWRWVPEIRTVQGYYDEPAYIRALAATVRELWSKEGEPEILVTSYHGIPKRYFENGDPYHCQCHKTSRLLAEELDLPAERHRLTFQSRLGREAREIFLAAGGERFRF
ncbi:MAG: hypothetical protein GY953_39125, partial [bacterium]|nr:hypothetical protein [bacterium]